MRKMLLRNDLYRRLEVLTLTPIIASIMSQATFSYKACFLPYFIHKYNATYANERMVEIPIFLYEMKQEAPNACILEIGNVLSHYTFTQHEVLDMSPAECADITCDVVDFKPTGYYDLIISISTLEHVGFDEGEHKKKQPGKIQTVLTKLKSMSNRILWSFTLGFNPGLDEAWKTGCLLADGFKSLVYTRQGLIWVRTTYAKPGDLIVLEWKKP